MNDMNFVKRALEPFCGYTLFEGRAAITTHCLYPSNSAVTVYVTGGPTGARVSDEGGAMDVLAEHNRTVPNVDRYLRRFCSPGLLAAKGVISSPPVTVDQMSATVMLVANASMSAANWGVDHLKIKRPRNLRDELYGVLTHRFSKDRIEHGRFLVGKSNRQYRFSHVVTLHMDHLLVIDSVLPDSNSINAHAIAHFDLNQRGDDNITQRMVYDDDDEWGAAELNLLQMAATLVPFSGLGVSLDRVAATIK